MCDKSISDSQIEFLRIAANYLEKPSYLMRIADSVGRPIQGLAAGIVPEKVAKISQAAIEKAMELVTFTISNDQRRAEIDFHDADDTAGRKAFWHKLSAAATGIPGGFFGLPGLAIELPVTTAIMLRSIASIATDFGHDVRNASVRLECIGVFSQGGPSPDDDAMGSSYLTARLAMAKLIQDATEFLAKKSATSIAEAIASKTGPALLQFIATVAVRFNVVVTQKFLVQSVPIIGAGMGALINASFCDHFNQVARFHFGIRKLENEFGVEHVQAIYLNEVKKTKR